MHAHQGGPGVSGVPLDPRPALRRHPEHDCRTLARPAPHRRQPGGGAGQGCQQEPRRHRITGRRDRASSGCARLGSKAACSENRVSGRRRTGLSIPAERGGGSPASVSSTTIRSATGGAVYLGPDRPNVRGPSDHPASGSESLPGPVHDRPGDPRQAQIACSRSCVGRSRAGTSPPSSTARCSYSSRPPGPSWASRSPRRRAHARPRAASRPAPDAAARTYEKRIRFETDRQSRHVPNAIKRAVWQRDQGQCAFVGTTGNRCAEQNFLEFHHIQPFASGGAATVGNISLRCRRHNVFEAELVFGPRGPSTVSEMREVYQAGGADQAHDPRRHRGPGTTLQPHERRASHGTREASMPSDTGSLSRSVRSLRRRNQRTCSSLRRSLARGRRQCRDLSGA